MADSVVTLRDVFELPHPGSPEESSPRWQSLRQWINEDLAAAKSPAIEDVGATIEELLNIPVTDIFVKSWKETDAIKDLLAESRKSPVAVTNVDLGDHTIKSKHHPHIEVRRKKAASKKIEFTLRLVFKLQGFSVRIQNGHINEIRTGPCEMQGTLQYQGLAIVEQKNGPIDLPEVIALDKVQKVEVKEPAPVEIPADAAQQQPPVEAKTTETAAPPPAVESNVTDNESTVPKVVEPVTRSPAVEADATDDETTEPKVEPQLIEPAALPRTAEPERVQSSPDFSSLIPPKKITPQETESASPPKVSDPPPEAAQTEEEEREVFVL